jgi:hypothetical protein
MHTLNFLVVELETARTKLLDVFEEANGTTTSTWRAALSGWDGWLTGSSRGLGRPPAFVHLPEER